MRTSLLLNLGIFPGQLCDLVESRSSVAGAAYFPRDPYPSFPPQGLQQKKKIVALVVIGS